jgi:multiple RNA-binding domain-containing protein 1
LPQAHVTLDKTTKKSKGIAFVTFADPSHALAAYRSSDGTTFQGRLLHIMPAIQLRTNDKDAASVKDKKRLELKAGATKDFNWNTMFMSADAVASSVASRLGVSKSDILNPEEDPGNKNLSPAVRLALAETSVIQETKEYLEKEGINVDAFQGSSVKRSDTVTLVKNIPFGTKQETLRGLFEKFGKVERVVMPPSGTVAIVEMEVSGESKVAFKALAYKRLGNSVLYLEKAPLGIMSDLPLRKEEVAAAAPVNAAEEKEDAASDATTTLFVKNLAFATTDERLTIAFSKFPDFAFARIQRRPSKNGLAQLSMGYGFVGFKSAESAKRAQKALDKTTLDGHLLSVSFSKRGHDADDTATTTGDITVPEGASTKLIIKNLPFQASKKDVRDLFAAHGKLKSVRVPKKSAAGINLGGGSANGVRGFGFVEFVNRKEAENAYKNLKHTHLLGRHMILEWDLQDSGSRQDQLDQLRKKTARGLQDVGIRKSKLHLNDEDIKAAAVREKEQAEDDDDDEEEEQ